MRSQHKKFIVILLASFWLCFSPQLIDFLALPASASIQQQSIIGADGSLISNLEDEAGNVWELIVWQEVNNGNSDIYLRLVGYPLFQLNHNRPLQFSDATHSPYRGKVPSERWGVSPVRRKAQGNAHQDSDHDRVLFEAEDLYSQKSSAFHVAKYTIKDIVTQLPVTETLDLTFNLTGDRHISIKLPSEVVRQWKELAKIDLEDGTHQVFDSFKKTFLLA